MANRRALVPVAFLVVAFLAVAVLAGCASSTEEAVEEVQDYQRQADAAAREANLRMIDTAVQAYYAEEGTYPSRIEQLIPSYFDKVPSDPAGGTYYLLNQGGTVEAAVR